MADPSFRGRFVWHELMTSDTKSAAAFYTKAIGWKTQVWDQNPSYTMFTAKGRPVAGLMALPDAGSPLTWLAYIATPSVDETARQAEGLGGKVLKKPSDIPTIGRFAVIQDPQGALFVAFTPLQGSASANTSPPVDDFAWHELATTDWRSALAFYKSLFGWEETESMDMGPEMGTYQMYGWKGRTLGGMMNKPRQSPGQPAWLSYIEVPDAKKAAATVKKLGGRIVNGPHQVPSGGWIATGLDLQGAAFAVHTAKAVQKAKTARKKSQPRKAKAAKRAAARKPAVKKQKMKSRKRASSRKSVASKKRR